MSVASQNAASVQSSILVIGLLGRSPADDWDAMLSGRIVVARSSDIATQTVPASVEITHTYDTLFDREPLEGIEQLIAADIIERALQSSIAYLVPGPGWIGDATVHALSSVSNMHVAPSGYAEPYPSHAIVSDALTLAQAQEQAPFDSGTAPLDATLPTVLFNCHGERIQTLVATRLRSVYGTAVDASPHQSGTLLVPARDALDSPPSFAALEHITARLRQPDGCPWDREQTHQSMLDDFASEVAEYAKAVRSSDWPNAAEELGDVLLNVLMQAQIGYETGHFRIEDVLTSITAKLVRRHPHVFSNVSAASPEDVLAVWNSVKEQEKQSRLGT